MKLRVYFSIIISMSCCFVFAQLTISPELKTRLTNKNDFAEIFKTIGDYYIEKNYMSDSILMREFKKWNRWAWYEMRHLDSNGKLVDNERRLKPILEIAKEIEGEHNHFGQRSNSGGWVSFGPSTVANGIGRVDRLAFHPTDPNQIYAGTPMGGLWKTDDGGASWNALHSFAPGLGVSGIIVDVDNPNHLYVLTGDGDSFINGNFIYTRNSIGLMRSTDGGIHWSRYSNIITPGTNFWGYKLIQSSQFHYIFFAATSDGLYRSTDFGLTWTRNDDIGIKNVFDVEQAVNGYVYASTDKDIYVSLDFGSNFTKVPTSAFLLPPTVFTNRTSIAVPPNAQNELYVHFGGDGFLYRSTNNASSFTLVSLTAPTSIPYMAAMTVNPSNSNNIILGSLEVNTSTDGGLSFPNTGVNIHADIHDLAYNPLTNMLYAACDGGVYSSTNDGLNWTAVYNGMNTTQYYHMGCFPTNNGILIAGSQDNGVHLRNNINSFASVNGGDGFDAKFYNNNSDIAYYSLNAAVYKLVLSTNVSTPSLLPGGDINDQNFFFPHLAIHPANDNIAYAGYISSIYRTTNGGSTWDTLQFSASAGFTSAGGLAVSANQPNRLYAANATTARRSDDQGSTWSPTISGNPGWPAGNVIITDIQTRSTNANEVLVTFGGFGGTKIIYSSNSGDSWNDITGTLPNLPAYCVEYTSDGDMYIGTDAGVYFRDALMNDWVRFSNGLPLLPVTELVVDETNSTINAATFGRGIWQGDLYSDCGPFLLLEGLTLGSNFYQSNGFIETTQVVPGSYGTELRLRSASKVIFDDGFRAFKGSYVRALIGNCGQGVFNAKGEVEVKIENSNLPELKTKMD